MAERSELNSNHAPDVAILVVIAFTLSLGLVALRVGPALGVLGPALGSRDLDLEARPFVAAPFALLPLDLLDDVGVEHECL